RGVGFAERRRVEQRSGGDSRRRRGGNGRIIGLDVRSGGDRQRRLLNGSNRGRGERDDVVRGDGWVCEDDLWVERDSGPGVRRGVGFAERRSIEQRACRQGRRGGGRGRGIVGLGVGRGAQRDRLGADSELSRGDEAEIVAVERRRGALGDGNGVG